MKKVFISVNDEYCVKNIKSNLFLLARRRKLPDVFNINKFYNLTFRITLAFPLFFLNI